jgi:hypothetical protein
MNKRVIFLVVALAAVSILFLVRPTAVRHTETSADHVARPAAARRVAVDGVQPANAAAGAGVALGVGAVFGWWRS